DAKTIRQFPFEASSVTFYRVDKRLLIGGYTDLDRKRLESAKIWGLDQPDVVGKPGSGPVTFREPDGAALQLVPAPGNPFTLQLWGLDKQKAGREFKLADKPPPHDWHQRNALTLAVSPDGMMVAASTFSRVDDKGSLVVWDVQQDQDKPIREEQGFSAGV